MKKIKPRYTITSIDDFFYERTPFINSEKFLSRIVNVSFFPSELKKNLKEKFLYAISIKPINLMQSTELYEFSNTNYSNDPFKDVSENITSLFLIKDKYTDKNVRISKEELYLGNINRSVIYEELFDFLSKFGQLEYLNMVYDNKNRFLGYAFVKYKSLLIHDELLKHSNEYSLNGRRIIISEKVEKIATLESIEKRCWFCFNNPNIDSDLLLKEMGEFYIAYPKGPIDDFHFLVLPKNHIKSFTSLNESQRLEYFKIRDTIIKIIEDNQMDYLIYEKNLPYKDEAARHMIINIVGIPKETSLNFTDQMNETLNYIKVKHREFDLKSDLNKAVSKEGFYYFMDAPTGIQFGRSGVRVGIIIDVYSGVKNFIDFPRMIICLLIDKEERTDWKNADVNKEFLVKLKDKIPKYFN